MIGKDKIKQITDLVLKLSKADETEVLVVAGVSSLTRFANNKIHQNVSKEDVNISIRAIIGKKIGIATGNVQLKTQNSHVKSEDFTVQAKLKTTTQNSKLHNDIIGQLKKLINKSIEIAKASEEDPEFPGLLKYSNKFESHKVKVDLKSVYESTVEFTAKNRAEAVSVIINEAKKNGLVAYGSLQNGLTEYVIANSKGVFGYHPVSTASLNIRVFNGERSGYSGFISTNISDFDFEKLAGEAVYRATFGGKPVDMPEGDYEVILEEPAVSEMMQFMGYLGFGAKQFHEGSSFVSGRLGEKVLGENVTIYDDPLSEKTIPLPFDFEGTEKKKITLVEKGVAKNIVYDNYHGKKHKKIPTGHSLPAPNTDGPFPFHINMLPGKTPKKELIKKVKNGILVTRFWYVNPIHPKLLNITGMTRDGTFLIKNGKIVAALRNLRFTQSIPEALSNVLDIAKEVKTEDGWIGANVVPALRIGKWKFTGESKL